MTRIKGQRSIWGEDIKEIFETNDLKFGKNGKSMEYSRKLYSLNKKVKRNVCLLYFLKVKMGMENVAQMFVSEQKQRDLIFMLIKELRNKQLNAEWVKKFDTFIKNVEKRQDYIFKIIKENIYLTKYYPYFEATGYEQLNDFELTTDLDVDEQLAPILDGYNEWAKAHETEIAEHLKEMTPHLEALEAERQRNKEKQKAEVMARREARKAVTAEVKEIKKWKSQSERVNRERDRYYDSLRKMNERRYGV